MPCLNEIQKKPAVRLMGCSVRGPAHARRGTACQDACGTQLLPDGSVVMAAADGLGSAARAEEGAALAVRTAIEFISAATEGDDESKVRTAVCAARSAIETRAGVMQCEMRDLATTLIVVLIRGESITIGHVGDGAVICRTAGGLVLQSAPAESEYANEVIPLTSRHWDLRIARHTGGDVPGAVVAVITDGCQPAALRKNASGFEPFAPFLDPIFDFAASLADDCDGTDEIRLLLESPKLMSSSGDDKTLLIAALAGGISHAPDAAV